MIKTLIAVLALFFCTFCEAQNTSFRVSPQLTISLPATPDSMETNGVKVYTVYTDSVVYQVGMDTKEMKVKGKQGFESGLKGFYSGYSKKLEGFTKQSSDTFIGGIKGAFMFAASRDTSARAIQLFQFYTIVSNHLYFIQCSTLINKPAMAAIKQFFASIRFSGENYPSDNVYAISYRIGQVLGYITSASVIFLLIRFIVRMITKEGKR